MDSIIDKVKIGENIRKIRHLQGVSQTIFAEKLGVKFQTISQIEKGQIAPSIEILLKISSNFRISIEDLLLQNEILTSDITPSLGEIPAISSPCPELLAEIEVLKATIAEKDRIISHLSKSMEALTTYINSLEKPLKNIPAHQKDLVEKSK